MSLLISLFSQAWFGSLLGILGLISAVYFYWRSQRIARLAFQRDTVTLLGSSGAAFPDEVEIKFAGVPISRVTADMIVLWNAGNTTIGGSQIVAADPLRFELKSGEILKTRVLKVTRDVNAITVKSSQENKRVVEVSFDYLDPNDGVVFEILHSSVRRDLKPHGTLRGMPGGVSDFGRANSFASRRRGSLLIRNVALVGAICFGLASAGVGFFSPTPRNPGDLRWFFAAVGLTYSVGPAFLLWIRRRRYPACLHVEQADDDGKK